jgi:hypothetical protein
MSYDVFNNYFFFFFNITIIKKCINMFLSSIILDTLYVL